MIRHGFGVIGCGVIGPHHAKSISNIENAKLIAVCDIVEEKAKSVADQYKCKYYTDYKKLLDNGDIDIVDVCVPSGMHADIAMDVARSGKNVIVEKPIDVTLKKADELINTCYKYNVTLSVISQLRYENDIIKVKKLIDEGKLGKINFGACHTKWYRSQEYYDSGDWRGTWALDGGGALTNQSVHAVDVIQYLVGPIVEVSGFCATRAHVRIEVEDIAVAITKFANGALGMIEGNTTAYPGIERRFDIYGDDGSIVLKDERIQFADFKDPKIKDEIQISNNNLTAEGAGNPLLSTNNCHEREIRDIINAIDNHSKPLVTGEEARKALAVLQAVYESSRTGKPVKVSIV